MRPSLLLHLAVLAVCGALGSTARSANAQTETIASQISAKYRLATTFLLVRGVASGQAVTKSGSGFIISDDGYAITSAHLFDEGGVQLQGIKTVGSLGTSFDIQLPTGTILPVELIRVNKDIDIALIKFPPRPSPDTYQFVHFCRSPATKTGARLHALGFPLGQPLSTNSGTLASKEAPRGLWKTDVLVYEGSSGGPVFDETGHVVAVVRGGISEAPGNNFVIPTNLMRDLIDAGNGTLDQCSGEQTIQPPSACDPKIIVFDLDVSKSDHPSFNPDSRGFSQTFRAVPGFTIESYQFIPESASNASPPEFTISGDKKLLTVKSNVTSGPFFDQYRGWLSGKIITNQKPECPHD
jgi:Trypsin-like peptidase domain